MDAWGWTAAQRLDWIEACMDLGITSFDHADIYGGYSVEALFGEALARKPALRQKMQLVTKCGIQLVSPQRPQHRLKAYDTSAMHIEASVDQSLRALRTDHLDLLLIHRPDPVTGCRCGGGDFSAPASLRQGGRVWCIELYAGAVCSPAQSHAVGHESGRMLAAALGALARRDV